MEATTTPASLLRLTGTGAESMVRGHESAVLTLGHWRADAWRPELVRLVHAALSSLPADHPVAMVAQRRCEDTSHTVQLGSVACGGCWEHAIRTDQQIVIEFDLPANHEDDPSSYEGFPAAEPPQVA